MGTVEANDSMEKPRSQRALDWVSFFLSDVEAGVGPFMAGYFTAVRHWNPEQIGLVLAAQKFASVATQATLGWLIDRTTWKTRWMASAALAISVGCFLVVTLREVVWQVLNQAIVGVATAMATLLISAISLGLVGRDALSRRIGRNGGWSHAGNMITASAAGYLGYRSGQQWIFYISALLGLACSGVTLLIKRDDIDDRVAREALKDGPNDSSGLVELLRNRTTLIFALSIVLFHVSNSSLLPLVGEEISGGHRGTGSLYITLCIVLPQVVMIPVALLSGRLANGWGRKPVFLVAFAALLARCILFGLGRDPRYLVSVELLDGIGTGIAGVVTVLVISDLAKGTGRFNTLGGMVQSCLGIGAFLGNLGAGFAAKRIGFPPVFVGLGGLTCAALILFFFAMPETKDGVGGAAR